MASAYDHRGGGHIGRFISGVALLISASLVWASALVLIAAADLQTRLPPAQTLLDGRDQASITVLDRDGALLGVRGQRFAPLTVDDAAPVLIDAVLAIEDRRFYWHPGLDPIGVMRAITANMRAGRTVQGGSSIPQQVAKLAFLSPRRTVERKLRELPLALAMDWSFSKDDLLSVYLNRVYLGAGAYGFEEAARRYFDKSARTLSTAEAALLAGLLRAPSRWSPENNFDGARNRALIVLDAMVESGRLSPAERSRAREALTEMTPPENAEIAPHFIDLVAEAVADILDDELRSSDNPRGANATFSDVVVETTLDAEIQLVVNQAIATALDAAPEQFADAEAAMAVMTLDGALRAMVGGRDYAQSQYNRAALARRQLGSAFKPFVYAAAFEAGVQPNEYVKDEPIVIDRWRPGNYGEKYRGDIPLEIALAESSNVAAVRMLQIASAEKVIEVAGRFGFRDNIEPYPSLALGTIETNAVEVANAYAAFARGGVAATPITIETIRTQDGSVVWERPKSRAWRAVAADHAGWLTTMMREVVWSGTGKRASLGDVPVAGKTGTTQSHRDAWFAGFTGHYVGVVWIGNDDNKSLDGLVGGQAPADIWRETMSALHDGLPVLAIPERPIPVVVERPIVIEPPRQSAIIAQRSRSDEGGFFQRLFSGRPAQQQQEPAPQAAPWDSGGDR